MPEWLSRGFRSIRRRVPLVVYRALTSAPGIFFLHGVGEERPHVKHLYATQSAAGFRRVLSQLLRCLRPLEDLSPGALAGACSGRFVLTFDDGLRSTYEQVVPLLEREGVPAIFFVNPDFMEGRGHFYRFQASLLCERLKTAAASARKEAGRLLAARGYPHADVSAAVLAVRYADRAVHGEVAEAIGLDMEAYFARERPYMTTAEAADLIGRGFHLGAHSCDHPYYPDLSLEEQVDQTVGSIRRVRGAFDLPYRYFAFPFSDLGVGRAFYQRTAPEVDLYFTTRGWRPPDRAVGVYHRVGLDRARSVVGALKSNWRLRS